MSDLAWGSRNVIFWSAHFINCPGSESLEVVSLKLFICARTRYARTVRSCDCHLIHLHLNIPRTSRTSRTSHGRVAQSLGQGLDVKEFLEPLHCLQLTWNTAGKTDVNKHNKQAFSAVGPRNRGNLARFCFAKRGNRRISLPKTPGHFNEMATRDTKRQSTQEFAVACQCMHATCHMLCVVLLCFAWLGFFLQETCQQNSWQGVSGFKWIMSWFCQYQVWKQYGSPWH